MTAVTKDTARAVSSCVRFFAMAMALAMVKHTPAQPETGALESYNPNAAEIAKENLENYFGNVPNYGGAAKENSNITPFIEIRFRDWGLFALK